MLIPKKASQIWLNVKVFFDDNAVVHHKFLPQNRMVNKEFYLEVRHRLCKAIRQKGTELWKN